MVKIGKKPILWHIMKIYSQYGYNDFIIAAGYKIEAIKEYFLNFISMNNDITINLKSNKIDLISNNKELFSVSLAVIIPIVIFTALFIIVATSFVVKAHKNKPTTGMEGIVGEIGRAVTEIGNSGTVEVHGEIWKARAPEPISKDTQIIIKSVDHMILTVEELKT